MEKSQKSQLQKITKSREIAKSTGSHEKYIENPKYHMKMTKSHALFCELVTLGWHYRGAWGLEPQKFYRAPRRHFNCYVLSALS